MVTDGAELMATTEGALPVVGEMVSARGKVGNTAIVGGRGLGLRLIEIKRL